MHNYIFDAATNGLLLQAEEINPVACKEPRIRLNLCVSGILRSSSAPGSMSCVLK